MLGYTKGGSASRLRNHISEANWPAWFRDHVGRYAPGQTSASIMQYSNDVYAAVATALNGARETEFEAASPAPRSASRSPSVSELLANLSADDRRRLLARLEGTL